MGEDSGQLSLKLITISDYKPPVTLWLTAGELSGPKQDV